MIHADDRFEKHPDVVYRRMKDEGLLLPVKPKKETSRQFYYFEQVGRRVWELLDENQRCDDIVGAIASEFGTAHDRVKEDVFAFLNDLEKEDLIRRMP